MEKGIKVTELASDTHVQITSMLGEVASVAQNMFHHSAV